MMEECFVPAKTSEGLYKEKGSKFMAYLFPIEEEEEVKALIANLKPDHAKARHFCYAFRLGKDGELDRASDDGEPSGSAGLPMLNQLKSASLTNVLVVVVRYFGGTKLGVSGLIHAYKEATSDAISNVKTKKYRVFKKYKVLFPISILGEVEKVVRMHDYSVIDSRFDAQCTFVVQVEEKDSEDLTRIFMGLKDVKVLRT